MNFCISKPYELDSYWGTNFSMKTKEIIKKLESEGWVLARQSHKQFKKAGVKELITVPDHGSAKEPSIGVINSIKKIAGWK